MPQPPLPNRGTLRAKILSLLLISAASGCTADANALATRYDIDATINVETHIAKTTMQATFRNDTGRALDQIVFNVEPNRKPGVFTLVDVTADTPTVIQQYNLTAPRLEINLRNPLPPKCEATFTLSFSVQPGPITQSYVDNIGYFGFSDRQLNLAGWLPQFAPYRGGEFYTPKAWPLGEYVVTDWSDFTAGVKLIGKDADKWQVMGPGATDLDGGVPSSHTRLMRRTPRSTRWKRLETR